MNQVESKSQIKKDDIYQKTNKKLNRRELRRQKKEEIEEKSKCVLNEVMKNFEINEYVAKHLHTYLSEALRNTHYYGNLRIKYVGFNFTFTAFCIAILTLYLTQVTPKLLFTTIPMVITIVWYLINFGILVGNRYDTISFDHSNLQHYEFFMKKENYPNYKIDINRYKETFKKELKDYENHIKGYSKSDDLKALIRQYFYQANYNIVGEKIRNCLICGIERFFTGLVTSLILLGIFSFYIQ